MVESRNQSDGYQVVFVKHDQTQEGWIEYLVKVMAPGNFSFHIRDRYSRMRSF